MAEWFPGFAPLPDGDGTRFRAAAGPHPALHLLLYDAPGDAAPARAVTLRRDAHFRDGTWEVRVPGVGAGQHYAWSVDGARPLLDPCAVAVSGPARFGRDDPGRPRPPRSRVNGDARFKSIVVAPPEPLAAARPRTAWRDTVIYEVHVRGFTRGGGPGAGTYAALADRAPYLRDLGVTAVELLPCHEFDDHEPRHGEGLFNFWGYSPIAWNAPNRRYAADAGAYDGPVREFRAMAEALHRAGIELFLDVVFNHTGELDAAGPVWHGKALDRERFYLVQPRTGDLANLTGCGNTVRAQHPAMRAMIRDSLRWWVHGLGVDGFRFDLAAILARDADGALLDDPPLLREIEEDPLLSGVKLIAEAWDAADGYLVPRWPGGARWAVWNDRFRDDVRSAWLREGPAATLATRLCGSSDLFRGPLRGVNYVTAHDGFTLRDVVSYDRKHNLANGEKNRDGHSHSVSWNHGVEGPARNAATAAARDRSRRNLVASLLLAQGVPMLLAGDEIGRTQAGNNNAWCHDGPLTWLDWSGLEDDAAFHRFVKGLLRLRKECPALRRAAFLEGGDAGDVRWFGPDGDGPDWDGDAFGYRLSGRAEHTGTEGDGPDVAVLVNVGDDACTFALPRGRWRVRVDTAAEPPGDLPAEASPRESTWTLEGRSLAVLLSASMPK